MNITEAQSSCWADLKLDILVKAFAHLPLKDGFSCEKVCTVWRRALLSGPVAGQNKARTLVLLHAVGSSLIHGDSSVSVAELNISEHKDGLAKWLSKRGSAFDTMCFGTDSRPLEVSLEAWRSLFSAFADTQGPQLNLSISSFHSISMPVRAVLRQRCTALYLGSGPGLTPEQLMAISHLTSLESLEIIFLENDYMGFLPSCWTRLSHLHSLTLNKCKAVPPVLATLASLRSLTLRVHPCSTRPRLETLLQLTSLRISLDALHDQPVMLEVLLPKGNRVQLRHLMLRVGTQIVNVQYATQLTRLDMTVGVAIQIRSQWHVPLENLKVMNVFELNPRSFQQSSGHWPSIWQLFTSLERLTLRGSEINEMPDWVTQLQQLRRLDMPQASLRDLSVADLMQLPHLEQLSLGNFSCDQLDALKPAIVECAYLPVLKFLTYGFHCGTGPMVHDLEIPITQETLQSKASPILQQLQAAFVSHRFAPFLVRQLTVTRQQNIMQDLEVTVVQFSCDD